MPTRKDAQGRWHVELCVGRQRIHRRLPEGAGASDAKRLEAQLRTALASLRTVVPGDPPMTLVMGLYTEQYAKTLRSPDTAIHHALRIGECEGVWRGVSQGAFTLWLPMQAADCSP